MPNHDISQLEGLLKAIRQGGDDLLKIIIMKGYTTPREFALVLGAAEAIAAQMRTLVTVSREIVGQGG